MARPEDFTHREVLTPRGRMHFVEAGKGKPLLLLHGGHGGWVHWIDNIHALAGARRVIAPDLPGFGLSDPPVAAPEFSCQAEDASIDVFDDAGFRVWR